MCYRIPQSINLECVLGFDVLETFRILECVSELWNSGFLECDLEF